MPTTVTVEVTGLAELTEKMRAMSADMVDRIAYRAVARVQRATIADAKANIVALGLVDTGAMERGVAMVRVKTEPGQFAYEVGVRNGGNSRKFSGGGLSKKQAAIGDDPWYWFLQEFGFTMRNGVRHGPTPFITPAFQNRMSDGLSLMGDSLQRGINKYTDAGES